jgi:hypothetical protein
MSKSTILLLMAGISLAPLAAAESTSANQVAALQKQIEALPSK